ncbi:MAG: sensor histidine kinase [Gaiellaceae bacterium]
MQLAENAAKHTGQGEEIAMGSLVENGEARFWIRDHGPGIAPAEQARVFNRFSRGPASNREDGSGLGLSIVRAIAEAHHGRVELASQPRSTTFTLFVPIDQPQEGSDL